MSDRTYTTAVSVIIGAAFIVMLFHWFITG